MRVQCAHTLAHISRMYYYTYTTSQSAHTLNQLRRALLDSLARWLCLIVCRACVCAVHVCWELVEQRSSLQTNWSVMRASLVPCTVIFDQVTHLKARTFFVRVCRRIVNRAIANILSTNISQQVTRAVSRVEFVSIFAHTQSVECLLSACDLNKITY